MANITNAFTMQNIFSPYSNLDRNRTRRTVFYGRVSTEHEAQISALENQIQWYDDQAKAHSNWVVLDKYIDEGITGTQARKRPSFLKMLEDARAKKFDLIVTREVCRFARNTVDTLVVTRELKNLGIEVYFVEDNIWTMDGDGELRLTIMATLAQEESRKVSERVKAGQHISREKGVVYGSGNILGYDRKVGETYTINKEQAETVRMIYDMYLNDHLGMTRIAAELIKRGRRTATGTLKWTHSNVARVLNNSIYAGIIAYGKSFSNNYLEQKRISNHNKDTYLYKQGDFEPIVTVDEYRRVQEIKAKNLRVEVGSHRDTPFGEEEVLRPKHENHDFWGSKLICNCGASFRKNRWHKNNNMPWSYGYQCYNQLNNGSKSKLQKLGQSGEGACDVMMVADWKLDFMAREIMKVLWKDKRAAIKEACEIIKKCYKAQNSMEDKTAELKVKLSKIKGKMRNLRDMRLEEDIDNDEFRERMQYLLKDEAEITAEITALTENKASEVEDDAPDYDAIESALERMTDFSEETLDHDMLDPFIAKVVVKQDREFEWYINLSGQDLFATKAIVEGRKKKATVSIDGGGKSFFVLAT